MSASRSERCLGSAMACAPQTAARAMTSSSCTRLLNDPDDVLIASSRRGRSPWERGRLTSPSAGPDAPEALSPAIM